MNPKFDLASVDVDGAIQEAAQGVDGDTRAAFFRKAAIGGGAVVSSSVILGMLPEVAMGRASKARDLSILNFALTLEFLEAEFYREAVNNGIGSDDVKSIAKQILDHEDIHVQALIKTIKSLGGKPVAKPKFGFKGTTESEDKFLATAFVLENTGVHAYLGQAGRLQSKALLAAAASIVTVEARHAAAVAILAGGGYTDNKKGISPDSAFDTPLSKKAVLAAVGETGFITG